MDDLLRTLAAEHSEFQQALAGIRPRQFRTEEGHSRIARCRQLLQNHMTKERETIYPSLEDAARRDQTLAGQLQRLSDDMRIVADLAEGFFRKYESGEPKLVEFVTDHGALVAIMKIRLRREEETLFPLLSRLHCN